jgi:hypothetical protein
MIALIRPVIVGCFIAVLATCLFALRFACSPADALDASRRREELQRLERATFRREEARLQVVRELIAQRCTLAEVIEQFQEWDHEWPDYSSSARLTIAEEKRRYQQIIGYIEEVLHDRPEELAAVLRWLNKESPRLQAGKPMPQPGKAPASITIKR